jgi:hypothetical protein
MPKDGWWRKGISLSPLYNFRHSGKIAFLPSKMRFYPESHLVSFGQKKKWDSA